MSAIRLCLLSAALFASTTVRAQSAIVLWPTDPKIAAGEQATALWLENRGSEPVTLQVRTYGWDQAAGDDRHAATTAIVSSPPIAQVAPGERQLVRIIRRGPAQPGEQAYRLLIDELPRPALATGETVAARLNVQMRYSLPLFAYGPGDAALSGQIASRLRLIDGRRWIEIRNSGSRHVRLTDLRANAPDGMRAIQPGLLGYVLPGATMRWPLPDTFDRPVPLIVAVDGRDTTLPTSA
ncbi:fimbrial biogenesis chaperone [Sphingomonas sp.]